MSKRQQLMEEAVMRGKYAGLYRFLKRQTDEELCLTFAEFEKINGFGLPDSAYLYRPWWANQKNSGHSQSMAWGLAGWKTTGVDMEAEKLMFTREV